MIGKCNSGISSKSDFSAIITVEDANNKTITATLDGDSITGIWNGKNYICTVNREGNWIVSNGSNSQTISVTTATNYNVKLGTATLTTLAGTYWMWNDYEHTTNGTAYSVNVTCRYTGEDDINLLFSTLYAPFRETTLSSLIYAYVLNSEQYHNSGSQRTAGMGYRPNSLSGYGDAGWVAASKMASGGYWDSKPQSNCKYFCIVSGSAVTNKTLIAYLQAHATQCDSNWNPL